jgi:hypothetical protein
MKAENIIMFAEFVMRERGIAGFRVEGTYGNEGFCDYKNKKILLGKNASKNTVLHEVAHIIAGERQHHYSNAFEFAYDGLCHEFMSQTVLA